MLWCFGLTILAEHPVAFSGNWDHQTNLAVPDLEWKTKAGRKIFEHGHKTVKLAYLNVLWATKGGVGVADEEALEAIRIASRTLQTNETQAGAVEHAVKRLQSTSAQSICSRGLFKNSEEERLSAGR